MVNVNFDEDEKYFGTPFSIDKLHFSELVSQSLSQYIRANCKDIKEDRNRYSGSYLNFLDEYTNVVIDSKEPYSVSEGTYAYILRLRYGIDYKEIIEKEVKKC